MKSKAKELLEHIEEMENQIDEFSLNEMANLQTKRTGLPVVIYVSKEQHSAGPRVKVALKADDFYNNRRNFSISVSDNPVVVAGSPIHIVSEKLLKRILNWVKKNRIVLLEFWEGKIGSSEMADRILKE